MTARDVDKLSISMEDYLEAIQIVIRQRRVARVRDIAGRLNVGMPSVTAALKGLAKRDLVNYDPYQYVTLTAHGDRLAEEIIRRHEALSRFLTSVVGLDPAAADANACRLEHAVDDNLLKRLEHLTEFAQHGVPMGTDWATAFGRFCQAQATTAALPGTPTPLEPPAERGPVATARGA